MRWPIPLVAVVAAAVATIVRAADSDGDRRVALNVVSELPAGYRDWRLVSVAREEGDLDDIRAILGNDVAVQACRDGKNEFPDGAVIARLAWSCDASAENDKIFGRKQSYVAGAPKNGVQFMAKDSKRYSTTGGLAFGQFEDGKSVDASKLVGCFACHAAVRDRDFVFTRYAR